MYVYNRGGSSDEAKICFVFAESGFPRTEGGIAVISISKLPHNLEKVLVRHTDESGEILDNEILAVEKSQ